MTKSQVILYEGKSSSILWDEDTDAWTYYSGKPDTETQDIYQMIPTIYRGVEKIAQNVGAMPFSIYKGNGEEPIDSDQDYQNVVEFLPNITNTFSIISKCLDLTGKAYLRKLTNAASIAKELTYYSPVTITPVFSRETGEMLHFERYVNKKVIIPVDEMLWFWLPDPYVEIGPPSSYPVLSAMAAAGVLKHLDSFIAAYFARGALRPIIVTAEGMPSKDERERMETWFNKLMGGIKRAFTWKVFNAKAVNIQQVGDGLSELRDVELTQQKRQDIAQALGIPYNILFDEAANFATAEQERLNFLKDTVVPRCTFIETTLNTQLLEPQGYRLEFNPQSLDEFQEDEKDRSEAMQRYVVMGFDLIDACDLLGVDLTDEMRAKYEQRAEEGDIMRENLVNNPPNFTPSTSSDDEDEDDNSNEEKAIADDLAKWERKALNALKRGKSACVEFDSAVIPTTWKDAISEGLMFCAAADQVRAQFVNLDDSPEPIPALADELKRANDLLERFAPVCAT